MPRSSSSYVAALLGVGVVAWLTSSFLPVLGLASAALLFLLPVLFTAARGGVGPGLLAALLGASAYNFFLLPPRLTFRVHGLDNLISVAVLVAVALVTSRLATRLKARENEALEGARTSRELAELAAALSGHPAQSAEARGLALIAERYGEIRLLDDKAPAEGDPAFSSLDLAAAAWAAHNGDITGHGSDVMPAADWTFLPLAPKNRRGGAIAAIARPADGTPRPAAQIAHLRQMCLQLGQCRDRDALEAERREREMLAESDRLRRTMLAALAHDFRTPLTVISGRLEMLADSSADAREALAAALRLDRMMSDLVGAARIEAGMLAPAIESVDLVDVVASADDRLARPPGITLSRAIPADLPFVAADPVLLQHVLTNLLDNALRHARARVTLTARRDGDTVAVCVADDGPGVPEGEQARIFERFARAEGGDRSSGSGLGLAIVKGFAEAMGMTVHLGTAPGGGAAFTLTIPLREAPRA